MIWLERLSFLCCGLLLGISASTWFLIRDGSEDRETRTRVRDACLQVAGDVRALAPWLVANHQYRRDALMVLERSAAWAPLCSPSAGPALRDAIVGSMPDGIGAHDRALQLVRLLEGTAR